MTSHVSISDEAIDSDTQLVRAQGELDLYAAPEFKRLLAETIESGKVRIVVDLTDAAFMDSTALGVLLGALKRLRVRDGHARRGLRAAHDPAYPRCDRHGPGARPPPHRRCGACRGGARRSRPGAEGDAAHRLRRRRRAGRLPACAAPEARARPLAAALRGEPDDVNVILPFDEVIAALGRAGERRLGLQVDPARLDRRLGGPHAGVRPRVPAAIVAGARTLGAHRRRPMRRGESLPPIDVYRVGDAALRRGRPPPRVGRAGARSRRHRRLRDRGRSPRVPPAALTLSDLPCKSHERLFFERIPLPPDDAQAHPPLRSVRLRLAGRGRGGLGLSRHAGAPRPHGPRAGRARRGSTTSTCRWSSSCARPT